MLKDKSVSLLFIFLFSLSFSSASLGLDNSDLNRGINFEYTTPTNYSSVNVNNSQYLRGYTPTTLPISSLTQTGLDGKLNLGGDNADRNIDIGIYNFSTPKITLSDIGLGSTTIDGRGYIIASDGETGFFNGDESRWIGFDVSGNAYDNNVITCWNGSDGICQFIDNVYLSHNANVTASNFLGDWNGSLWDRTGTTLSPKTAGDDIATTGQIWIGSINQFHSKFIISYDPTTRIYELWSYNGIMGNSETLTMDFSNVNKIVYGSTTGVSELDYSAMDLTTTGTLTATGYNDTNWNTAYTHSQDNTQAHSDYILNNADDTTSGTLTAGGFTTTGTIQAEQLTSTDDITMAGYFLNTLGATDYTGFKVDGRTNPISNGANALGLWATREQTGTGDSSPSTYGAKFEVYSDYANTGSLFSGFSIQNTGLSNFVKSDGAHSANTYMGDLKETNIGAYNKIDRAGTVSPDATYYLNNIGTKSYINHRAGYNKAGRTFYVDNVGDFIEIKDETSLIAGTLIVNNKGLSIKIAGNTAGTSTNYGIYLDSITGADTSYGIWDASGADWALDADNQKIFLGEGQDASIYYDGTNQVFITNNTGSGLAWFSNNVSATGYITRTSVYDKQKGNALDFIKDADDFKTDNKINHEKFYGFTEYNVTDFSRPINESYVEEVCEMDEKTQEEVCRNETFYRIIYPYQKAEEGVSLDEEINVLRQAVYELKLKVAELERIK